jgi:hypothetical protein
VTVTFHAVWMLCALGAATFAAVAAPRRRWLIALAIGFASAIALSGPERLPDAEMTGFIAAAGGIVYLFFPRYAWLALLLGGAVGGMLIPALGLLGAPSSVTAPVIALGMAGTVWLARTRSSFSPETLREEALLIVSTLGLAVAVLPSVLDGWQAAGNLNIRVEDVAREAIPTWALSVVAMSTLLGAAYALWSRR